MELTSFGQNVSVWFQEISTSPSQRVIGNSEKEGVLKAKVLKRKYEHKLEFPERHGGSKQKPCMGGLWIFSGTTQ